MSTLVLTENFPPRTGGSGRWLWEVYARWPNDKLIVFAGQDKDQAEFDARHNLDVRRIDLTFPSWGVASLRGFGRYLRVYRTVSKTAKRLGVQAIHCGRCLPEGLIAWAIRKRRGIPYACYVHGEELNTASTSRELTFLTRRVFKSAQLLIANSQNTARTLIEKWHVRAGQVEVLHPGVDTARFAPAARDMATRGTLCWGDRPVVLTVGRLQERKGQDRMIRALVELRRSHPEVLYAIVGDGDRLDFLLKLTRELGLSEHVQFLGEVPDELLRRCYQQCDVFALPNITVGGDFEGFGMVLVEAQSCGRPVVAGRSGGTSETMAPYRTGLVINCENPAPLASAVEQLLSDNQQRHRMGQAARQWVLGRFDWNVLAQQAQRLFAERFGDQTVAPATMDAGASQPPRRAA